MNYTNYGLASFVHHSDLTLLFIYNFDFAFANIAAATILR